MTWLKHHRISEVLASEGDLLARKGDRERAREKYRLAAHQESQALAALEAGKRRTWSITAVSAASLHYMANDFATAERLAHSYLADERLLPFGQYDLKELLQTIWDEQAKAKSGTTLVESSIETTLKGGQILRGAAPAGLVDGALKRIVALFMRVAEHECGIPYRLRGGAPKKITDTYEPWILQADPGSFRFGVTLKGSAQLPLPLNDDRPPSPAHVVNRSLEIVDASIRSPEHTLPQLVNDPQYRRSFLTLTRNLAPSGLYHEVLELHQIQTERRVLLSRYTRDSLTESLRQLDTTVELDAVDPVAVNGILRGVDLNNDWLRLDTNEGVETVSNVGDTVDDIIGPMVNRPVLVTAYKQPNGSYRFVDIEPLE